MDFAKLEKLIELAKKHAVSELSVEEKDAKVTVKLGSSPQIFPAGLSPTYAAHAYGLPVAPPSPQAFDTRQTASIVAPAPAGVSKGRIIKSPFVGTFYRAPAPGSANFADIGKRVKKGDTLCIIEAMKLMNEIEAEFDGVIKEILVENEQPVEFDQALFVVE